MAHDTNALDCFFGPYDFLDAQHVSTILPQDLLAQRQAAVAARRVSRRPFGLAHFLPRALLPYDCPRTLMARALTHTLSQESLSVSGIHGKNEEGFSRALEPDSFFEGKKHRTRVRQAGGGAGRGAPGVRTARARAARVAPSVLSAATAAAAAAVAAERCGRRGRRGCHAASRRR